MLPLDGYVRVSKVGGREGEGFIAPETQERAIREWAERNGVEVVLQPRELNVSGGTMDRPVFNRIMERIRRGESGGIVVHKTDRFARTVMGAVTTLTEVAKHGATFASATEPTLDYTTPSGRAFLQQMFVFAEFLRSTLKESWALHSGMRSSSAASTSARTVLWATTRERMGDSCRTGTRRPPRRPFADEGEERAGPPSQSG